MEYCILIPLENCQVFSWRDTESVSIVWLSVFRNNMEFLGKKWIDNDKIRKLEIEGKLRKFVVNEVPFLETTSGVIYIKTKTPASFIIRY